MSLTSFVLPVPLPLTDFRGASGAALLWAWAAELGELKADFYRMRVFLVKGLPEFSASNSSRLMHHASANELHKRPESLIF